MKRYLFLAVSLLGYGLTNAQILHHQMLGAQGGSASTSNNLVVLYTVGQQSVTGTTQNGYVFQQGFQQSNVKVKSGETSNTIFISAYPNPFLDKINIFFSSTPGSQMDVFVFDLLGRLVYSKKHEVIANTILLDLKTLSSAEYVVQLIASSFSDSIKIIKQ